MALHLKDNNVLKKLDLRSTNSSYTPIGENKIGDKGLEELKQALMANKKRNLELLLGTLLRVDKLDGNVEISKEKKEQFLAQFKDTSIKVTI